ncbi:uncharacterized protein C22orf15-like [Heterodontus francisci]|uniref:uncharacterized protein C22orf15-like n=1 Tax=Heterodontus francisci TaxID=7792 RepID=UPI00355BC3A8
MDINPWDWMHLLLLIDDATDQTTIFNHLCRIVNFIDYVKQTCECKTEDCIDLIDESGNLMNLSVQQNSLQFASDILKERRRYILIKVTKQDDSETIKYESMLKNIENCHPVLADQLRKLSNPKAKDRKEPILRKSRSTKEVTLTTPSKNKSAFGIKKNPSFTHKAF